MKSNGEKNKNFKTTTKESGAYSRIGILSLIKILIVSVCVELVVLIFVALLATEETSDEAKNESSDGG